MHGASLRPKSRSASSETYQARQVKARIEIRQIGHEKNEKSQYSGMPTTVPAVPGASGENPVPKPADKILTNFSFKAPLPRRTYTENAEYRGG